MPPSASGTLPRLTRIVETLARQAETIAATPSGKKKKKKQGKPRQFHCQGQRRLVLVVYGLSRATVNSAQ